jgi:putative transposase
LFETARRYRWRLQAWALLPNHYHFIALPEDRALSLPALVRRVHAQTARELNRLDRAPGRRVWFQYWDTHITYPRSYYARLNYVNSNPAHHHLVGSAASYRWCSAAWFEQAATPAFQRMVAGFRTDRLGVPEDFLTSGDETEKRQHRCRNPRWLTPRDREPTRRRPHPTSQQTGGRP